MSSIPKRRPSARSGTGVLVLRNGRRHVGRLFPAPATWGGRREFAALLDDLAKAHIPASAVIAAIPETCLLIDRAGTIIAINESGAARLGQTQEALVGTVIYDHLPPEVARNRRQYAHAAFVRGRPIRFVDDNGERVVQSIVHPVPDARGKVEFLCVLAIDITRHRRLEVDLTAVNRCLRMRDAVSQAQLWSPDEPAFLATVARHIAELGDFSRVSFNFREDSPGTSLVVLGIDAEGERGTETAEDWHAAESLAGPMRAAMNAGTVSAMGSLRSQASPSRWRDLAIARGCESLHAVPLRVGRQLVGAIGFYSPATSRFDSEETERLADLGLAIGVGIESLRVRLERDAHAEARARHEEQLRRSLEQAVQAISSTVEARDAYTAGHSKRVGELAAAIALELGLHAEQVRGIRLAAAVHDLGKIHIPAEILTKPGKLSPIEFRMLKSHPESGHDILKDVDFPWPIADVVLQHHERLDGSGYPSGLKGEEILLEARILAVADVFDAMSSNRPYRPSLPVIDALAELSRCRGNSLDANAVDACLRLVDSGRFTPPPPSWGGV